MKTQADAKNAVIGSDEKLAHLNANLAHELKSCEEKNAKFIAEFQKDAAYALSWGSRAFENAGKEFVTRRAVGVLAFHKKEGMAAQEAILALRAVAVEEALRSARHPASSTSAVSNQIEISKGAAWAELVESLAYFTEAN